MTTHELKELFLKEHGRDKKFTIINLIIMAIIASLVISLLLFLGVNFTDFLVDLMANEYALYYKLVLVALAAGAVGYVLSVILKLRKRPAKIDEFISKLEQRKRAMDIGDYVEHKITIPLLKINIKLCPITYIMVTFEGEYKPFTLPIHPSLVADIKTLVSGADMSKMSETWSELYSEEDDEENPAESDVRKSPAGAVAATLAAATVQDESAAVTPLKSSEEFRTYLKENLSDTIEDLESSRKSSKNLMLIMGIMSAILAVGYMAYILKSAFSSGAEGNYTISFSTFIPVIAAFALFYFIYYIFIRPKQIKALKSGEMTIQGDAGHNFKTKLFDKIIRYACPDAEYALHGHVSLAEFLESGMFDQKNYKIDGNDLVVGKHSGVPFQFCDLTVSHQKTFHKEGEDPDYVLYGQFFVARFNKSFSTPVYIVPKNGLAGFFTNNEIGNYLDTPGDKIELEDPDFMKMFKVYGGDQIEARYILTPSLMERIKNLAIRTKGQYYISFYNNKITVANNSGKNNFEVSTFKSIAKNDNKLLIDFYQEICDQLAIIDELKLNVKIWR